MRTKQDRKDEWQKEARKLEMQGKPGQALPHYREHAVLPAYVKGANPNIHFFVNWRIRELEKRFPGLASK